MSTTNRLDDLYQQAQAVAQNAHVPYSKYQVGSALRLQNGKTYSGCNIENASYGATICAERTAIVKALSENPGQKIEEIVVFTHQPEPWPPCGLCRQVIAEFATKDTKIHTANHSGIQKTFLFTELFPSGFGPEHL